ncbi:MAG: hypothetical protein PHV36_00695 [Elusimicrobiales bacterium]|nr:hypothetical protein [Elusimicrobiales bacterium]
MKLYLSSLSALFSVLFSVAAPAFCAEVPYRSDDKQAQEAVPVFTKYEEDVARQDPSYFTINPKSIRVQLIETKDEPDMSYVKLQEAPPKDLNSVLVTIDQIVNIASKVWNIIQANAPVVNIDTKYATAYPQGITSASQLAQWSRPKSYVYGFYAENLYGGVMIDCKYKMSYTYNGNYKGKGKFLTGVAVIPASVSVGWGYKFYMSAAVPDSTIANVGTHLDPVAAMQMKLSWKMATVLKEVDGTSVYYVQGDGYYEEIANPWKYEPSIEYVNSAAPLLNAAKVF